MVFDSDRASLCARNSSEISLQETKSYYTTLNGKSTPFSPSLVRVITANSWCFCENESFGGVPKETKKGGRRLRVNRSVMPDSAIPWIGARQAPPSMGFSRQEYWNELPFPSPKDLPDPGIKPRSPAMQADSLPVEPPGKPLNNYNRI